MAQFYFYKDYRNKLKNPHKYKGNKPLTLRSSYECRFVAKYLDPNPRVKEYTCESVVIPYLNQDDQKMHKYYMDFWVKYVDDSEFLIEIKPHVQTVPVPTKSRKTKSYKKKCEMYKVNTWKWKATERYVENQRAMGRNIQFKLITEKELF